MQQAGQHNIVYAGQLNVVYGGLQHNLFLPRVLTCRNLHVWRFYV